MPPFLLLISHGRAGVYLPPFFGDVILCERIGCLQNYTLRKPAIFPARGSSKPLPYGVRIGFRYESNFVMELPVYFYAHCLSCIVGERNALPLFSLRKYCDRWLPLQSGTLILFNHLFCALRLFHAVGRGLSPAAFRRCDFMRKNRLLAKLYSSQTRNLSRSRQQQAAALRG